MNVSAIIVTRGNVDLQPVLDSLPPEWERVVWDNSSAASAQEALEKAVRGSGFNGAEGKWLVGKGYLSVYGRYAAIEYASHDLIYVQDDDVIVSDPQAIMDEWERTAMFRHMSDWDLGIGNQDPHGHLVANMPQEFRHDGYTDSCLVGFGACFHRNLPARAFEKFTKSLSDEQKIEVARSRQSFEWPWPEGIWFHRTCDVVFTTLTPRVLVDIPKTDREFASDDDRMWRQPEHHGERVRMLELTRKVRDAG